MTELQDAPPNPFEDDVVEDVDDVAGDNQTSPATASPPVSFNWDFDGERRKKFACAGLSKTIRRTNAVNSSLGIGFALSKHELCFECNVHIE